MLMTQHLVVAAAVAVVSFGAITVQRAGWLDRAITFYKQRFVDDVAKVAPATVQLQASMATAPPGYVDSPAWDEAAVDRLLALLAVSDHAAPVRHALRRALRPSLRRVYVSKKDSWNLFPSIAKDDNQMYYDFPQYSDESNAEMEETTEDTSIVKLRNPVEARLPSATISVQLLKDILLARALAGRQMPKAPTRATVPWNPIRNLAGKPTKKNDTGNIDDSKNKTGSGDDDSQLTTMDTGITTGSRDGGQATGDVGAKTVAEGMTTPEGAAEGAAEGEGEAEGEAEAEPEAE